MYKHTRLYRIAQQQQRERERGREQEAVGIIACLFCARAYRKGINYVNVKRIARPNDIRVCTEFIQIHVVYCTSRRFRSLQYTREREKEQQQLGKTNAMVFQAITLRESILYTSGGCANERAQK